MAERADAALGGRRDAVGLAPEGRPEELARRVRRALERRRARVIYPRFYTLARWMPWLARWITDSAARGLVAALPPGDSKSRP
jgi:hypothetical protein